jgi:hypothetical protein
MDEVHKINYSFFIETIDADIDDLETQGIFRIILLDEKGRYIKMELWPREAMKLVDILAEHITCIYRKRYYELTKVIEKYNKEYEDKIKHINESRLAEQEKEYYIRDVQLEHDKLKSKKRQELAHCNSIIKKYTLDGMPANT